MDVAQLHCLDLQLGSSHTLSWRNAGAKSPQTALKRPETGFIGAQTALIGPKTGLMGSQAG